MYRRRKIKRRKAVESFVGEKKYLENYSIGDSIGGHGTISGVFADMFMTSCPRNHTHVRAAVI